MAHAGPRPSSEGESTRADAPGAASPPLLVVGVGASAGGLEACQRLLKEAPADAGLAFVVVLHLAPDEPSHVAEILDRVTDLTVTQITGEEPVERDHVYVIAPGTSLGIRDGTLVAGAPDEPHFRARPIDSFFSALAADRGPGVAGVVLSGSGDDGSAGLRAIREAGGLCLVQTPSTAAYGAMPQAAIDTGTADSIVSTAEMGEILRCFAEDPANRPQRGRAEDVEVPPGEPDPQATAEPAEPAGGEPPPELDPETVGEAGAVEVPDGLEAILDLLGSRYRVDFRDYKRGTMERRTARRMGLLRLDEWQDYLDYLNTHPEEVEALYDDLLVGVPRFFRDPEDWAFFAREIVPTLIAERGNPSAVRAWAAGCATGEEAYGIAMVLLEHLEQLETAGRRVEVKVFASDASSAALETARRGRYPAGVSEQVSKERLERFFRPSGGGVEVASDLRSAVTFAAHDLLSDPPFPHLDLITCRNVLIYLDLAAQERLLERFHFALRPGGTLWLGAAETVGRRTDLFTETPGNHRIYRATATGPTHGYSLAARRVRGIAPATEPVPAPAEAAARTPQAPRMIEKLVLQRHTTPCVVVDQGLEIRYFFGLTDPYLTRPPGEARLDLLSWVRPELYAKLRVGLTEAFEQRQPITLTGMRLEGPSEATRVEIVIEPIAPALREGGMLLVAFRDASRQSTAHPAPDLAPEQADEENGAFSRQIYEELQDTREHLRTAVDQLRTATEEHSAGYEELLSLNEELQSSNEELEASKEELQSLNEELTTTNRQLEERNEELRTLTSDLDNLLVSADLPTLFLDRDLKVRRFTPATTAVARIGPTDLGRPLATLALLVEDDDLLADAERVLADPTPIEAEVTGEDERWFSRRVLPYRTADGTVDGVCLTFHEITPLKKAAAKSEYARLYAEAIIRTSRTPLLVLDTDHRVVSANQAFYETFEIDESETVGRCIYELGNGQWAIPRVRALLDEALLRPEGEVRDYDVEHLFERIGWRSMRLNADVMPRTGRPDLILVSIEDVTDLRKAEMAAQSRADDLAEDHRRKDQFLAMLGHELRNPLAALSNGVELLEQAGGPDTEPIRCMMARQTGRMTAMLDQLLDVARVISGKLELVREAADLAEAARSAVESVKPMLEAAGHELTVSIPPAGAVLVHGDAARLAQVTENLLANAAKYTDDGGRIQLTVEATDDTVELSVRDTGIGVEPEVLPHIFDLFTQAPSGLHRAKGGLGLGLPLVRNLVQMHGGSVEAFSAGTGKGTEMVVTLPRLRTGRRSSSREKREETEAPASPVERRILVVDDEPDTAGALAELLGLKGHTARAVPDGASALALVETFDPELVLLDLGLPGMNGYQVARKLRESLGKRVMLVALTGYQDDPVRLKEAGFDAHLLKPTSLEKLFTLVSELDRKRAAASSPPEEPA